MQEELNQFERTGVWKLVPIPKDYPTMAQSGYLKIKWMKMA